MNLIMKDFKYFTLTILSIFFISEALKAAPPGRRAPSRTSKSPSKAVESRRPALPTRATDAARNSLPDLSSPQNTGKTRTSSSFQIAFRAEFARALELTATDIERLEDELADFYDDDFYDDDFYDDDFYFLGTPDFISSARARDLDLTVEAKNHILNYLKKLGLTNDEIGDIMRGYIPGGEFIETLAATGPSIQEQIDNPTKEQLGNVINYIARRNYGLTTQDVIDRVRQGLEIPIGDNPNQ